MVKVIALRKGIDSSDEGSSMNLVEVIEVNSIDKSSDE